MKCYKKYNTSSIGDLVPYFQQKYTIDRQEVVELWFEAKGTASGFLIQFFKNHDLKTADLIKICLEVIHWEYYDFYAQDHTMQNIYYIYV